LNLRLSINATDVNAFQTASPGPRGYGVRVPPYTVTTRVGPRVDRQRFQDLDGALRAIEARGRELSEGSDARPVQPRMMRRFEPVQQVLARLELSGPGRLRGGIDVRGDGSTEGYTGRFRRQLVEQRGDESPYDALRRTLEGM
jgi:hypothetical protein